MILLNGEQREHLPGQTVAALVISLGLGAQARGVAVAIDGEVVPRVAWEIDAIPDGARVEVLRAMQGG